MGAQQRELLLLLPQPVVTDELFQGPDSSHEDRIARIQILYLLHHLHDFLVLLLVLCDRGGSIGHPLLDRRIDIHFLRNGMAHDLCYHAVGQVSALFGIDSPGDLAQQCQHLLVVGRQDLGNVTVALCHDKRLLIDVVLWRERAPLLRRQAPGSARGSAPPARGCNKRAALPQRILQGRSSVGGWICPAAPNGCSLLDYDYCPSIWTPADRGQRKIIPRAWHLKAVRKWNGRNSCNLAS